MLLKITGTNAPVSQLRAGPSNMHPGASANPDISVIGDFQGLYRSYGKHNFDAVLNEAEFSFQSVIDPYARADFFYSVGEDPATGKFTSEIEEGYLTTLVASRPPATKGREVPAGSGPYKPYSPACAPFYRYARCLPFFLATMGSLGDGYPLSWLLPNPAFFQELTFEATGC